VLPPTDNAAITAQEHLVYFAFTALGIVLAVVPFSTTNKLGKQSKGAQPVGLSWPAFITHTVGRPQNS